MNNQNFFSLTQKTLSTRNNNTQIHREAGVQFCLPSSAVSEQHLGLA
jgi:hypothetical protein